MYRGLFVVLAIVASTYGSVIIPRVPMLDGRIVGGESTDIQNYPYQVSVRLLGSHSCGGSILTPRTILTAAHCIYTSLGSFYSISYGSTNVNGGKTIKAQSVVVHSSYNSDTIDFDVALIYLAEDIEYGSNAQPIGLADSDPAPGTRAVVSGWGTTSEGGSSPSILQRVDVNIVSQSECAAQYQGVNEITSRMLCAGVGGGKDACQGDSGGPLAANGVLVGIVSWGVGCARPDFAGVYSNVANLRSWIDSRIK